MNIKEIKLHYIYGFDAVMKYIQCNDIYKKNINDFEVITEMTTFVRQKNSES